jgi:hypothetical protein
MHRGVEIELGYEPSDLVAAIEHLHFCQIVLELFFFNSARVISTKYGYTYYTKRLTPGIRYPE